MKLPRRSPLTVVVVGLVATAALVAGCTAEPEDAGAPSEASDVLEAARQGGAGDAQIAVLEEAVETQEVTLDSARQAARNAVQCMSDNGLDASYVEETTSSGVVIPGYQASGPEDQIAACDTEHAYWVSQLYQIQPSSVQTLEDYADQQEPVLRACLEEAGVATDPEATGSELASRAAVDAPDCLADAGIDGW